MTKLRKKVRKLGINKKPQKKDLKYYLKKTWWFIWEDDSIWSWMINIVLAFVIIKFLVYPGLGFLFSTSHPIVAVVSSSMEHDGNFDTWWSSQAYCNNQKCTQKDFYNNYKISEEQFLEFKYKNGFNTGDIMILYGTKPKNIKIGDVIVFNSNRPDPIIHRVVQITQTNKLYFSTKGDHNMATFKFETQIPEDYLVGRAVVRIPYLGYIKIGFVKLLQIFHIL